MRNWLMPGEQVIVVSRPQARRLTLPAITAIVLPTLLGLVSAWLSRTRWVTGWEQWRPTTSVLAGILVGLILLCYSLRKYLQWLATKYILTNRRLVLRSGLLVRRHRDIPLFSVRTLSVRQGVLQRIFRSGNITLVSGSEDSAQVADVPEVQKFKNLALDAIAELPHSALLGEPLAPAQDWAENFNEPLDGRSKRKAKQKQKQKQKQRSEEHGSGKHWR